MAMADGRISREEEILIASVMKREGLSLDDVKKCLDSNIVYPTDVETRCKYLADMLALMIADGKIDDNELMLYKVTARALDLEKEAAVLLDAAIQAINKRNEGI